MSAAWKALEIELERWRDAGRGVEFWLRDDDATAPQAALERLFELTGRWRVPIALAVIPQRAEPALFAALPKDAEVLQHGFDHRNRAAEGEKKSEFPPGETAEHASERLRNGRQRLAELAGARSLDVLVPPWNRISASLVPHLASWGFRGLSRFGARPAQRLPGLRNFNTHVDVIAWKGDRGFVGLEPALQQAVRHLVARREAPVDSGEPTGWLTHHACHDAATWSFLEELFARMHEEPGVRWRSARELFGPAA
jgi:hypothetical protein